jgi:hypothetical protein
MYGDGMDRPPVRRFFNSCILIFRIFIEKWISVPEAGMVETSMYASIILSGKNVVIKLDFDFREKCIDCYSKKIIRRARKRLIDRRKN